MSVHPYINRVLNPRDRDIIDADSEPLWIPQDPRETILPYIDQEKSDEDLTSVESIQKKAKEVYDNYGKIIDKCLSLEAEIERQCKNVKVPIVEADLSIRQAIKRVFGTSGEEITFDMYKKCIKELAKLSNGNIPKPTDKGI